MSLLAQQFREKVSGLKDYNMKVECEANVGYSSGFLHFDFKNGTIVHGVDSNGNKFPYYSIGITDGSMVMVIGRSGCGKTTWAIQTACNIVARFPTACVYYDDIEGGITGTRKSRLSRYESQDVYKKIIHRNTGINAENFFERIKIIHDIKINNRSDYEYDTGLYDEYGKRIFKLEPTVYLLDSLALLMPQKYADEDELSGQMAAPAVARANAAIFKRIVPLLKAANIILIVINHVNQNIDLNAFSKKQAQVSYLKQDETVPGGNTPIYLSNLFLKFVDNKKFKEEEGFGITGNMVDIIIVKSRNNKAGQVVTMVFDQENGYDNELSLLVMLKEAGRINGAGAYLRIGDSDIKFSQKKFKEILSTNEEFRTLFMQESLEVLKGFLSDEERVEKDNNVDIASMMLNQIAC